MKYTTLGKTDIKVSKICLGTMTFGEQNTQEEAFQQLDYALDKGVNFIDTAEMYAVPGRKETQGLTEKYIGKWIGHRKNRDRFILGTKVAGPSAGLKYLRDPLRLNKRQIHQAIEGSLQRLQTDYIDLYQIHWPGRKTNFFGKLNYKHPKNDDWKDNFLELLHTFDGLIKAGKIRCFGVSNETPWGLMHYLKLAEMHDLPRCVSIQNPYNLLNRSFEVGLAEIAVRESTGLLAYSPMAFGLLSGKFHKGLDEPQNRINQFRQMSRYNGSRSYEAAAKYLDIAEKHGLSFAQMSLAFVTAQPFVTSNIIGATNMDQLRENIASIDVVLSEDVIEAIESVGEVYSNPAP